MRAQGGNLGPRVRYNAALKVVRRVHLFAGLFLTPWVFLYGVTALLFNHPDAFPDRASRALGRAEIAGTALQEFPTAPELADRFVEALNARADRAGFRLLDRARASYSRAIVVTAGGQGGEYSVRFDPDASEALIRPATPGGSPASWPGAASVSLADPPGDKLVKGVPALLARLGIETSETALRNPPDLICDVAHGGRNWHVAYNIKTGAVAARPVEAQSDRLSTRLFLTRLHLSHTYPPVVDVRWFWAIAVDAMFVAMVFWGISGLLMWWQMKKLRRWGALTLIVSAFVAIAMAVGMHQILVLRA